MPLSPRQNFRMHTTKSEPSCGLWTSVNNDVRRQAGQLQLMCRPHCCKMETTGKLSRREGVCGNSVLSDRSNLSSGLQKDNNSSKRAILATPQLITKETRNKQNGKKQFSFSEGCVCIRKAGWNYLSSAS